MKRALLPLFVLLALSSCSGREDLRPDNPAGNLPEQPLDPPCDTIPVDPPCDTIPMDPPVEEPDPVPEPAHTYAIGDPYPFTGTPEGIVVGISGYSLTLMSLDEKAAGAWSATTSSTGAHSTTDGFSNTETIKALPDFNAGNYPAAWFCTSKGDGWYLPGYKEFGNVITDCGLLSDEGVAAFNSKISSCGGTALKTPAGSPRYWSSSESSSDATRIYTAYVASSGTKTTGYATSKTSSTPVVRCLRKVDLPFVEDPSGRKTPDVEALLRKCSHLSEIRTSVSREIWPGLTETDLTVTMNPWDASDTSHPQNIYVLCVDTKAPGIALKVAMPDNSPSVASGWKRQNLTLMSQAMEQAGETVLAMVNADFWNTTTIVPRGPVHFRSSVVRSQFDTENKQQGASYVGVKPDGEVVIDWSSSYKADASVFPELTGGGVLLVKSGAAVDNTKYTDTRNPRTAVGKTRNGYVFIMCIDGRRSDSAGVGYADMSKLFVALGCSEAVNLDGGGSTQMLVRDPATSAKQIRNHPSDGSQRSVIDGWAVVAR